MSAIVFALLFLVSKKENTRGEGDYERYNNSNYSLFDYEYND